MWWIRFTRSLLPTAWVAAETLVGVRNAPGSRLGNGAFRRPRQRSSTFFLIHLLTILN
jgi:hypothetical protein